MRRKGRPSTPVEEMHHHPQVLHGAPGARAAAGRPPLRGAHLHLPAPGAVSVPVRADRGGRLGRARVFLAVLFRIGVRVRAGSALLELVAGFAGGVSCVMLLFLFGFVWLS